MKIEKEILTAVKEEAIRELLQMQEKSTGERIKAGLKNTVKRAAGRYVPPADTMFWPAGLLAGALVQAAKRQEESDMIWVALEQFFGYWIKRGMPLFCLDDALGGYALIALYEKTGSKDYRVGIEKIAAWLLQMGKEAADEKGSLLYRRSATEKYIFVDAIGMICPFLCRFGEKWGNEEAFSLSLRQISNMLSFGMDEHTGLPYHGYTYQNRTKHGIIGWGRALGWMLLGMEGSLLYLPAESKEKEAMLASFRSLTDTALKYQRQDGSFSWQLPALEGPRDTSATGMIVWAVGNGFRDGFLPAGEKYLEAEQKAAEAILCSSKEGKIYDCSGECQGFGQYPQYYGAYSWAQGPGLAVLSNRSR